VDRAVRRPGKFLSYVYKTATTTPSDFSPAPLFVALQDRPAARRYQVGARGLLPPRPSRTAPAPATGGGGRGDRSRARVASRPARRSAAATPPSGRVDCRRCSPSSSPFTAFADSAPAAGHRRKLVKISGGGLEARGS